MENFKIPPMTYSYDSNCDSIIIYNATTESFKDFEYPKGLDSISIQGDYLDHLDVPEGVTSVALGPLGLRTLKLPDGIEYVYVGYNNLREIELPTSIIMVDLGNNPLYHLKFRGEPKELARLELRNTHIHQLYVKIIVY